MKSESRKEVNLMKLNKNQVNSWGKVIVLLIIFTTFFALTGCGDNAKPSNADESKPLELTSTAFKNGGRIDIMYTNSDSIPLAWNKAPKGTKSFAVFMVDLHPVADNWVHWVVVDIPAVERTLADGASGTDKLPADSKELINSSYTKGYSGPQPPYGSGDHEYKFILYALNVKTLDAPENDGISYADFQILVKDHVIESAEISGFYEN
jgi:Raf kinase inhibitor-like YbhB/YbcL family protein